MSAEVFHRISAVYISIFVAIHLLNHLWSIWGAADHIQLMNSLRVYYRNIFAKILLLTSVAIQIISGIQLYTINKSKAKTGVEKWQQWTGLYLLLFLVIHLSAVFAARLIFHLDTNFYFGVAGINTFPINLFFIPCYALAVISLFGHLATIHARKMKHQFFGIRPTQQAILIITIGIVVTFVLFYGFTNKFKGVEIPTPYRILSK